jgi:hypothetical protein
MIRIGRILEIIEQELRAHPVHQAQQVLYQVHKVQHVLAQ